MEIISITLTHTKALMHLKQNVYTYIINMCYLIREVTSARPNNT
jgi:hypothetical protein